MKPVPSGIIVIDIALMPAGRGKPERYVGQARILQRAPLVVEFPIEGRNKKKIWIAAQEVVSWRDNEPVKD